MDIAATEWVGNTGSRPSKENFVMNWRPNSERIVVVFSDEIEQSFLRYTDRAQLGSPITKAVVEDTVRAGIRLKVYAFSSGGFANRSDFWTDVTLAGRGSNFDLTSNALNMYNDLMSIIDEACLPRDEDRQGSNLYQTPFYFHSNYDIANMICI